MTAHTRFGVIVRNGEDQCSTDGMVMGAKDAEFWVVDERDGWVEATSTHFEAHRKAPRDLKTFATKEEADAFGQRWKGHPWWCVPASYRVVEVHERHREVFDGWGVVKQLEGGTVIGSGTE